MPSLTTSGNLNSSATDVGHLAPSQSRRGGLSPGAKIGLGVVIPLIVLVMLGLVFLRIRITRRWKAVHAWQLVELPEETSTGPELESPDLITGPQYHFAIEVPKARIHELSEERAIRNGKLRKPRPKTKTPVPAQELEAQSQTLGNELADTGISSEMLAANDSSSLPIEPVESRELTTLPLPKGSGPSNFPHHGRATMENHARHCGL